MLKIYSLIIHVMDVYTIIGLNSLQYSRTGIVTKGMKL